MTSTTRKRAAHLLLEARLDVRAAQAVLRSREHLHSSQPAPEPTQQPARSEAPHDRR